MNDPNVKKHLPKPGPKTARIREMLRVDHAGEYGAVQIYRGQRAVFDNNTLGTAVAGAGFGALIGSSFGGRRAFSNRGRGENALAGALAGAAAGTGVGVLQGQNAQADIVYRCMRGRGYRILG